MLTLNDIVNNKKKRDERKMEAFQLILKEICSKIKKADEVNNLYCIYDVPEFLVGYSIYSINEIVGYLLQELSKRGFQVQYIFPKILIISWFNVLNNGNTSGSTNNNDSKKKTNQPKRPRGRPPKKQTLLLTQ
jgi:hypothetical protein